ncbi:P-loop containing nucleoside triphosphate hydrolase protein [Punctularia strigosozonata HHB-11173 SS5]|uniref:P-loop containing nucleoside triphosphate hydrolase protein n=1 Tax=Punctularia strigosozonata (strain HHB-11173) TaxID=741275 RepID=UPI0004417E92|nr:P-loop containing nucleoside triphosphate hydrolase protein [Punctularia strigosozonata HHB-11173 SS5]EIN13864.1 P-loop containing nucleoside triphosphate hydrolase protein [Punctularia strigosozonata HHB-11173 SS5]
MPPKRGIVKSGNSGNSSKSSKPAPKTETTVDPDKKSLFPPGSKYPLALLQERCQKQGWDKPSVNTGDKFSFSVTLRRWNNKKSETESVHLEPHPPYFRPSAIEARHWGATYALYRFCNGIQLNRVLPPGPREYWNELATEHRNCPEHQKWMYYADPFEARKEVDERQAKATQKRGDSVADKTEIKPREAASPEFAQAPEVRMAGALRDLVEDAVKQGIASFPEASIEDPLVISEQGKADVLKQLQTLGFTAPQARKATQALSQPSSLTSTLLSSWPPLQACIEYIILHVPECDLPERFLPSRNSSDPFVSSTHGATDNLKTRWMQEKAVKIAGFPVQAVEKVIEDGSSSFTWSTLLQTLNARLVGEDVAVQVDDAEGDEDAIVDEISMEGTGAFFSDGELVVPLYSTPGGQLHLLVESHSPALYCSNPPPMYIASPSVPAYLRLHLLARLIHACRTGEVAENGVGFLITSIGFLDQEWTILEDKGPPEITTVLKHLLPQLEKSAEGELASRQDVARNKSRKQRRTPTRDPRTDAEILQEFQNLCHSNKYSAMFAIREKLPAFTVKDRFIDMLETNRVVVVVGETGCGKTTQLPQFILDHLILSKQGASASIVVTQPRRLSAIGVAARVSAERIEDGSVGYAIRGENKQSKYTKLLFCTTGVVLRRLAAGDSLDDVTHVVIDEVHERSVDSDFLLLELKGLLQRHNKLKIILMSATVNHERFIEYFGGAPLLMIPGFTHPVTDMYLEDFIGRLDYRLPANLQGRNARSKEQIKLLKEEYEDDTLDANVLQYVARSERIDFQLVAAITKYIVTTAPVKGGVLIFLPGVQEIRQCIQVLRSILAGTDADFFPLHANLSSAEQRAVFGKTGKWKIIAATNVAETSITIDDVIYVVDCGKVKETGYDPATGMSLLEEKWVTRAAARQRRGRAGRTRPGVCYKVYSRKQEAKMGKYPIPEILRVPLESVLLTIKSMREDADPKAFLSQAIDPPKVDALDKAWSILGQLGAVDEDNKLTALGRYMSMLPLDLRLGKMLILATVFRCLDPVLTVAACLSSKPLFLSPIDQRDEASRSRARFAAGGSDLLTDVRAYEECMQLRSEGKGEGAMKVFCTENFISPSTVRDITSLRSDLLGALSSIGFVAFGSDLADPTLNANRANQNLVKAVILGGLWPRVARVSLPQSAIKFDKVQAGTVQRENVAKEYLFFDVDAGSERVFLHPSSVLFKNNIWKSHFLAYFQKARTSKVFLRDATELPTYALLLFGGPVTINHIGGGLVVGDKERWVKLKAWPRIGVLVNHLRRLLDAQLQLCIEEGNSLSSGEDSPVSRAICALLEGDGLSSTS